MAPKVSVCVPCLNSRPFIAERLETILCQTVEDWELIVCDSYSDDGTWEALREFAGDERVSLHQVPRQGLYAGWNECLKRARGEYVYIAPVDDTCAPDFLEKMVGRLGRAEGGKLKAEWGERGRGEGRAEGGRLRRERGRAEGEGGRAEGGKLKAEGGTPNIEHPTPNAQHPTFDDQGPGTGDQGQIPRPIDIDVRVFIQGKPKSKTDVESLSTEIYNIPELPRSLKPWRFWRRVAPTTNRLLRDIKWRFSSGDVFHPTYFTSPPVHAPSFCFVYDMTVERFPESFDSPYREQITERKRRTICAAEVVLCISENTKRDVVQMLDVPEEKCRVVYLAGFSREKPSLFTDGSLAEQRPFFLYVGDYMTPYKNFDFLARCLGSSSFGDFEDFDLVVVSSQSPTREMREQWEHLFASGRLRVVTDCDDARLTELYRVCSAFIFPSLYEGFGIPVLEALGCGAPVVCSDSSSLPEVGGDRVYYFDARSPAEFRAALNRAVSDGRGEIVVKARQERAQHFSWDHTAHEFVRAFRDVCR